MSATVLPINRLPPEILSRILVLATTAAACRSRYPPPPVDTLTAVTSVCTHWREIATSTRSIWSHVDIRLDVDHDGGEHSVLNNAKLSLERARGGPIHLHVGGEPPVSESLISQVLSTISPHSALISSLRIDQLCDLDLAKAILTCCSLHCPPGALDTLTIRQLVNAPEVRVIEVPLGGFRGLVHFQFDSMSLSSHGFLQMLSNNPSLRSLRLRHVFLTSIQDDAPGPLGIALPHLKLLDLVLAGDTALSTLLPMLDLGSSPVEFRFSMSENLNSFFAVQSFARRTNIESIYAKLTRTDYGPLFSLLFPLLPSLCAVFLELSDDWTGPYDLGRLYKSIQKCYSDLDQTLHTIGFMHSVVGRANVTGIAQLPSFGPQLQVLFVNSNFHEPELSRDELAPLLAPSLARVICVTNSFSETNTWLTLAHRLREGVE